MSEQQALALPLPQQKNYGNWVRHAYVEDAGGRIALWLVKGGFIWISSKEVAGKSHFLQAICKEHPQVAFLDAEPSAASSVQQLKQWLNTCEFQAYWILDLPSGALSSSLALAVFHLIERAKDMSKSLLICWRCEEKNMQPPELSSRLLVMERVDMGAPQSDDDLKLILESVLQTMQWDMKETVLSTLLQYVPRTLSDLLAAIEKLDMYSRKHQVKMNGVLALKVLVSND